MRSKDRIIVMAFLASVLFIGFMIGCSSNGSPEQPEQPVAAKDDPSFSQDIQSIFNSNCTASSCHGSSAQAGLTLISGQSYNNLVNVDSSQVPSKKRVLPSDAANSYLVNKIEGTQTVGGRMPLNSSALSSTQIQNIKNWINQGAENN